MATTGLINTNHDNISSSYKVLSCSDLAISTSGEKVNGLTTTPNQSSPSSNVGDEPMNIEDDQKATTNNGANGGTAKSNGHHKPTNGSGESTSNLKKFKVDIPRISSRDLRPQRPHSPVNELEQKSRLFSDYGSKREANKLNIKLKTDLEESIKKSKKFAMEQSVRFALVKQQQQQQKQQLELIKKQQALLLMCRIYVGSIFYEVKEDTVRTSFGMFGPIRSISMSWDAATNKHKGFAFIEFETPEAAQLALEQMNGALLGGRNIKVGRPSNMPQAQPIIDQLTEEAKNFNRIYMASVHAELSEQDVQSVFEAFGTIKSCSLVRDIQTGKHKGYGFIEYETAQAAHDSIASMNLFDLGGQLLRVGKAVTPPEAITTAPTAATLTQITGTNSLANASLASQMQDIDKALNSINAANALTQAAQAQALASAAAAASATSTLQPTSQLVTSTSSTNLSTQPSTLQTNLKTTATISSPSSESQISKTLDATITTHNSPVKTPLESASTLKANTIPSTTVNPVTVSTPASQMTQFLQHQQTQFESVNKIELTENQKKLLGMTSADDPSASLEQQVDITLKGKEQRMMLMQKLMQRKQPASRVLILRNMVGPDDVDEELENEITDECGKYGEVERVVIYQEKQGEEEDAEVIVKIFVEFTNGKSVESAVESLNGRFFAGRVVKAEVYDQVAYDAKEYSG